MLFNATTYRGDINNSFKGYKDVELDGLSSGQTGFTLGESHDALLHVTFPQAAVAQPEDDGEPEGAQDGVEPAAEEELVDNLGAVVEEEEEEAQNEAGNGNAVQGECL